MKAKILITAIISIFIFGGLLLSGCDEGEVELEETQADFIQERRDFGTRIENSIEQIDERLNEMQQELAQATGETRDEIQERIDDLTDRRDNLQERMMEIRNVTEDEWDEFRMGVERTFEQIGEELDREIEHDREMKY